MSFPLISQTNKTPPVAITMPTGSSLGTNQFLKFPRSTGGSFANNLGSSFVLSMWVNIPDFTENRAIAGAAYQGSAARSSALMIRSDGSLHYWQHNNDSGYNIDLSTASGMVAGQWYHIQVNHYRNSADITDQTVTIYRDGVAIIGPVTAWTSLFSNQHTYQAFNANTSSTGEQITHTIGAYIGNNAGSMTPYSGGMNFWRCYMIDGDQGDFPNPSSFISTDSNGNIGAIPYTGGFGTNGYFLEIDGPVSVTEFDLSGNGIVWEAASF